MRMDTAVDWRRHITISGGNKMSLRQHVLAVNLPSQMIQCYRRLMFRNRYLDQMLLVFKTVK
jgi:hypothetical protein